MTTSVPPRRRPAAARADGANGRRTTVRVWMLGGVILAMLGACTTATGRTAPTADRPVDGGQSTEMTASGTGLIPPDTDLTDAASSSASPSPDRPTGPPDAALLTWLDGPAIQGVLLGPTGQRQWFGAAAGEHATLGDGWYRYFGPDGSLVGCASSGACVGVGADGTIAVSMTPGGHREVYSADGTYLGSYNRDGDRIGETRDPSDLPTALAATKVDVTTLVNAASMAVPFAGGVTGDPHLVTMAGQRYTTQVGGQYIARAGDAGRQIQLEFSPMAHRPDVSIVSAVAIGTGHTAIVVTDDGTVSRDGQILPRADGFEQTGLAGGSALGRWPATGTRPKTVVVAWPDGGSVQVTARGTLGLTVIAHLAPTSGITGIFGSAAVTQGADLTARGESVAAAGGVSAALMESWLLPASSRLLPEPSDSIAAPISTASSDGQSGTAASTSPAAIDPGAEKTASRLCGDLARSQDIAACSFDVALTGDTGFIPGHVALSRAANSPAVPAAFARRWPALVAGPVVGAADLPTSGRIDLTLKPGTGMLYQLRTSGAGAVRLTGLPSCDDAAAEEPGMDRPAWRLFDRWRRPVSDRLPLCGAAATESVPGGDYLLAVANALGAKPLGLTATVVAASG